MTLMELKIGTESLAWENFSLFEIKGSWKAKIFVMMMSSSLRLFSFNQTIPNGTLTPAKALVSDMECSFGSFVTAKLQHTEDQAYK